MSEIRLTTPPVAKNAMLIRKPAAEVFQAIVDPDIMTKYWITKSSGPMVEGATLTWEFEMYGISFPVEVLVVEENERVKAEWPEPNGGNSSGEWILKPIEEGTYVTIISEGFTGDGDEIVARAIDSSGGFATVLASMKAWLEHGLQLHLVRDAHR